MLGNKKPQVGIAVLTWGYSVERVTRIELALSAWEADVLPLNYTRIAVREGSAMRRIIPGPGSGAHPG